MAKRVILTPNQPHVTHDGERHDCSALDTRVEPGEVIAVGRDRSSHLRFPALLLISMHHATITLGTDGCLTLKDISRNGIFIRSPGDGQRRSLGKGNECVLLSGSVVTMSSDRALSPMNITYTVRIEDAPKGGRGGGAPAAATLAGPVSGKKRTAEVAALFSPDQLTGPPQPVDDAHDASAPARLRETGAVFIRDRRVQDDFEIAGEQIQEGGFARVFKCTEKATGRRFAVKRIDKAKYVDSDYTAQLEAAKKAGMPLPPRPSNDISMVASEVDILHRLRHQHVVRLYQAYEDKTCVWLVQELVNGELFEKVEQKKKFEERKARGVMRQLLDGVAYCHSKGVIHRDLKPENVLLMPCVIGPDKSMVPLSPAEAAAVMKGKVVVPAALAAASRSTAVTRATSSSASRSTSSSSSSGDHSSDASSAYTGNSRGPVPSPLTILYVVKICDFGMAALFPQQEEGGSGSGSGSGKLVRTSTVCGTDKYMAPEMLVIDQCARRARSDAEKAKWAASWVKRMQRDREQTASSWAKHHPSVLKDGGASSSSSSGTPKEQRARLEADAKACMLREGLGDATLEALGRAVTDGYTARVDSFSLGVIAYVLLTGKMPFFPGAPHETPRPPMLEQALLRFHDMELEGWEDVSSEAKDFVRRLLDPNPDTRPLPQDLLGHPWLARTSSSKEGGGGGDGGMGPPDAKRRRMG